MTALFLAVFVLGCLYYFCGGDPCPFHHDRQDDGLAHTGEHSPSHCPCASSAADRTAEPVTLCRIECLGRCLADESPLLPDVVLPGLTHPPQA